MTSAPVRSRALLLGSAAVCMTVAGALFWQYATSRGGADFTPPQEDICIVPPARVSLAHPYDPASGLGMYDVRPIPADARCPVCGMYPARFPKWAAQIIFKDGSAHFFDSPVDLFMFLEDSARFDPTHKAEDAAALYVADHRSGAWVDARQATFVIDSSAKGPMRGPDLPAFAKLADAQAFATEHGGRTLGFVDLDRSVMGGLRSSTHAGHTH